MSHLTVYQGNIQLREFIGKLHIYCNDYKTMQKDLAVIIFHIIEHSGMQLHINNNNNINIELIIHILKIIHLYAMSNLNHNFTDLSKYVIRCLTIYEGFSNIRNIAKKGTEQNRSTYRYIIDLSITCYLYCIYSNNNSIEFYEYTNDDFYDLKELLIDSYVERIRNKTKVKYYPFKNPDIDFNINKQYDLLLSTNILFVFKKMKMLFIARYMEIISLIVTGKERSYITGSGISNDSSEIRVIYEYFIHKPKTRPLRAPIDTSKLDILVNTAISDMINNNDNN